MPLPGMPSHYFDSATMSHFADADAGLIDYDYFSAVFFASIIASR